VTLHTGKQIIYGEKIFAGAVVFQESVECQKDIDSSRGETSAIRALDVGSLHMIPHGSRPATAILNAGTATSYTDVDFGSYCPIGVRALLLKSYLVWTGNSAVDAVSGRLRKNGNTTTDIDQVNVIYIGYTDLAVTMEVMMEMTVECDTNGVVEYLVSTGAALSLNIIGYYT